MTEINENRLLYDSDVFAKINTDIALSKGSYYGTMCFHSNHLKRIVYDDLLIKSNLNLKSEIIKVFEPVKLVNLIEN